MATNYRRGMILITVGIILSILAIFIFSYNYLSRRQYDRMHFEEISQITSGLALNGARLLSRSLQSLSSQKPSVSNSTKEQFKSIAPFIFAQTPYTTKVIASGAPNINGTFLQRVAAQYQNILNSYQFQFTDKLSRLTSISGNNPVCELMGLEFSKPQPLVNPFIASLKQYQTVLNQLYDDYLTAADSTTLKNYSFMGGWDSVEKWGEVKLTCRVYFRGVVRTAIIKRQYKVVSMIPGPYARFSVFAPYTPHPESFNEVTNVFDGTYDTWTTPAKPNGLPKTLVVINGTDTFSTEAAPPVGPQNDTNNVLARNGWIFLGPPGNAGTDPSCRTDVTRNAPVILKIPAGYAPAATVGVVKNPFDTYPQTIQEGVGGHIYLSWPKVGKTGKLVATPRIVTNANKFNLNASKGDELQSLLCGVFTKESSFGGPTDKGAESRKLWHKPDPSNPGNSLYVERPDCMSSWLMPYGSRHYVSRTLMVGFVLADFMEYHQLIWDGRVTPKADNWGIIRRYVMSPFDLYRPFSSIPVNPHVDCFIWKPKTSTALPEQYFDFLKADTTDIPPDSTGALSFEAVSPRYGHYPTQSFMGVPFHAIFDLMAYSTTAPDLSKWQSLDVKGIGKVSDRRVVPGINNLNLNSGDDPSPPPCPSWRLIQPPSPFQIWHHNAGAGSSVGTLNYKVFYYGNLLECHFQKTSSGKPGNFVKWGLLPRVTKIIDLSDSRLSTAAKEAKFIIDSGVLSDNGSFYTFKKPGVFFIKRPSSRTGDIKFDKPIKLESSGILILENGNLMLKGVEVESPYIDADDGTSKLLFSAIALDGYIRISPRTPYDPKPVHAYLAALNPAITANGNPASVISDTSVKNIPANQIYISGGMAAFTIASPAKISKNFPTFFNSFYGGGIIRYNPRFNPYNAPDPERYQFCLDDIDLGIEITGAND
ncbi:MAG: hypothetical protein HQM10_13385 [Candidatus Riflebacteria bacterium]|nr:hypothetical protein [Candidatus Riflebacteria bacterium]